MITVQSTTFDKELSIPQNWLEKANFGDKVRIIIKEGEIRGTQPLPLFKLHLYGVGAIKFFWGRCDFVAEGFDRIL